MLFFLRIGLLFIKSILYYKHCSCLTSKDTCNSLTKFSERNMQRVFIPFANTIKMTQSMITETDSQRATHKLKSQTLNTFSVLHQILTSTWHS